MSRPNEKHTNGEVSGTAVGVFADPRALLASIVESSDDAIVSATLDGVITSWNAGAERLYGFPAAEVIGRVFDLATPPFGDGEAGSFIRQLREGVGVQHVETKRIRKDGTVVEVAMTVSPVRDAHGLVVGASAVIRDVTELKAARRALLESEVHAIAARTQAAAEEEVSRAKGEVVSLVSHELRSPLASIVGFTELLFTRDLSETQRKVYLGVMLREGRRLTDLVNDVLHLQRLEGGHQKLTVAPVDIRSLIQRAVDSAGEDDRRPIGMIMPEPLPLVLADPDAILQVLSNFLSNARKFSPVGGAIRIGARVVDDTVLVYVRDEGLGIPPDALPKLFQKFFRVDSPDRRLIRGSGLGLSINQRIIQGHGGHVEAHSEGFGKGSRFEFTLPIAKESAQKGDVLIIEDDPSFARVLEAELAAQGLTAVWASDAETAEHLMRTAKPRALILDLKLPGIQGEDFLMTVRAEQTSEIPVVVLTVKDLETGEIEALKVMGVVAVLPKEAGAPQAAVTLIADTLSPHLVAS